MISNHNRTDRQSDGVKPPFAFFPPPVGVSFFKQVPVRSWRGNPGLSGCSRSSSAARRWSLRPSLDPWIREGGGGWEGAGANQKKGDCREGGRKTETLASADKLKDTQRRSSHFPGRCVSQSEPGLVSHKATGPCAPPPPHPLSEDN